MPAAKGRLPPLREMMHVDPKVLAILGKTVEQLADMGLAEFAELSYEKGIVWNVSADGGVAPGLTVRAGCDDKGAKTA